MRKYTPALLLLSLLATACLGTARITTGNSNPIADNTQIDGIPFYPKRAVCRQDTIWLEPLYVLTREDTYPGATPDITKTPKQVFKLTKLARRSELTTDKCSNPQDRACKITSLQLLDNLQDAIATKQLDTVNAAWKAINVTKSLIVTDVEPRNVLLASNTLTSDFFTDYTKPYYFNTRMPWLGSSTANASLDKDGSLTNGTATVDNQTAKAVLDVLPISALLSKALGLTSAAAPATPAGGAATAFDGGAPKPESITLTIETRFIQHTLTAITEQHRSPCGPIPSDGPLTLLYLDERLTKPYQYHVDQLATPTSAADKPKADDTKKEAKKDPAP
jgi:hypothetical protein